MALRSIVVVALWMSGWLPCVAAAQTLNPGPPGPFVVDLRAATSGVPSGEAFYPGLPQEASVPGRGFGGGVGGHIYPLQIGPARIGLGVDAMFARGSTADASSTLITVAPQISANFGTSDGWSYLSAGIGTARLKLDPGSVSATVRSTNFGGGARWFLSDHVAFGFDVRMYFTRAEAGTSASASRQAARLMLLSAGVTIK